MIRVATEADIPALVDLGQEMHLESNFSSLTFDVEKTKEYVKSLLGYGIVFCSEDNGKITGFIAGFLYQPYFSYDFLATDIGLFITKDARGGMAAPRLIDSFTKWAESNGAKQVRPGISVGGNIEGVARLYERMGYSIVGSVFMKEIQ